ncbi:MAG: Uncharacterised protein [Cellulomonadaceae bacterium TMED98]|nr:MAG: Uncharacterised protein [Cellulomonadaceae bacterium TMED98]
MGVERGLHKLLRHSGLCHVTRHDRAGNTESAEGIFVATRKRQQRPPVVKK